MNVPLELSFHHLENTDALEALVRQKVAHLEKLFNRISSCRVAVERSHSGRSQSNGRDPFRVRVDVTVPPSTELVAVKQDTDLKPHQDIYIAVRQAFAAVERQLKRHSQRLHGSEVAASGAPLGYVQELYPEEDYGFIRTSDDRELYFHRNALSSGTFEALVVGQAVHFNETLSDQGPKATRVKPFGNGVAAEATELTTETNGGLH
jgi:ribosomal subunit interface protein